MNKKIALIIIITGFFVYCAILSHANDNTLTSEELESRLLSLKNPFETKLPVKEEIVTPPVPPPIPQPKNPEPVIPDQPRQWRPTEDTPPTNARIIPTVIPVPDIPVPQVIITGVIWNSDRPQAIIDGKIVDIGDTISDLTITDIQKTEIKATFNGKPVTIQTQRSQL